MLYTAYELQRSWLNAASTWASVGAQLLSNPALPIGYTGLGPVMASALEVFAHASAPYGKPAFDIEAAELDGTTYPVTEAIVMHRPWGNLLRFTHEGLPKDAPKLLIVAPMSGHFATLLRGTVARMAEAQQIAERTVDDDCFGHRIARTIDGHCLDIQGRFAARRGGVGKHLKRRCHHRSNPERILRHQRMPKHLDPGRSPGRGPGQPGTVQFMGGIEQGVAPNCAE